MKTGHRLRSRYLAKIIYTSLFVRDKGCFLWEEGRIQVWFEIARKKFENSRECWILYNGHDRELLQNNITNNKITAGKRVLLEITRSLVKPLKDNGVPEQTRR